MGRTLVSSKFFAMRNITLYSVCVSFGNPFENCFDLTFYVTVLFKGAWQWSSITLLSSTSCLLQTFNISLKNVTIVLPFNWGC